MPHQKKKGIEPIFFFPLYPFRAGAFRCIDLTGGKVVSKFGAYHFTPEDFALVKSVAPEAFTNDGKTLDCNLLESIIIREHNVRPQDTKELSCPQILAMLKTIQAKRLERPGDSDGETEQKTIWTKIKAWLWKLYEITVKAFFDSVLKKWDSK